MNRPSTMNRGWLARYGAIAVLSLVAFLGFAGVTRGGWLSPPQPPSGNTAEFLTVSGAAQVKQGGLELNAPATGGISADKGLIIGGTSGEGALAIGVDSATEKLDVEGNIALTGLIKINKLPPNPDNLGADDFVLTWLEPNSMLWRPRWSFITLPGNVNYGEECSVAAPPCSSADSSYTGEYAHLCLLDNGYAVPVRVCYKPNF